MSIILMVVMVSQVIRIKTHCIAHFKYMLFIVCQLFLNKTFF